ncbi:hypothetical protein ZIOFF_014176 [Zingiber officinale]|uniref:Pentatricopeptide repeat-containing protein n=1 Tax=Zingiber officinale TaxID=94328 RepID=A0A8J5HDS1_ZINOF|nr:hypothetical protein ZIOFF_014176 [Zingiber officinale]
MLFRPNLSSLPRIPRRCSTSCHLLSCLAAEVASEEEQELVPGSSSTSETRNFLGKIVPLLKPEAERIVPCGFVHEGISQHGALKKEMVPCPKFHVRYWISRLEACHALARDGRLDDIIRVLRQMVYDQGAGSAPLFCEHLLTHFRHWDSSSIVWDMLANIYARSKMIDDARFVLREMAILDMQASVSTYHSFLYSAKYTDIVLDLYREIQASGVYCGGHTIDLLIDGLCKQGRVQDAISFFQEISKEKSFYPCLITFNSLISGACNSGFILIAWSLLSLSFKYGFVPDKYSYNALMHGLCLAGKVEEALELFERMQNDGIEADVVMYNTLINGCRLIGSMREIWMLIRMMIKQGLQPDLFTNTIVISGLCDEGNVNEGLKRMDMLDRGCKLNIVTYSVLFIALFKRASIAKVEELLNEIKDNNLDMDLVAYSILISGYCKLGEINKALQLCQIIRSNNVMPISLFHRTILSGMCKKGLMSEAKWYLEYLVANGQALDITLYNIVIDGFAKVGDVKEALGIYEQLIRSAVTPTVVTYNSLIYGFCKIGNPTDAKEFLKQMDMHGLAPTATTYSTLIDGFCEIGDINSMRMMLEEMDGRAIIPNKITYSVVIKALCKSGQVKEAFDKLNNMVTLGIGADSITYNTVMKGFCEQRNSKMVFHIYDIMINGGLVPTPVTYTYLIDCLCLNCQVDRAEEVLYFLLHQGIRLRKFCYMTVIQAYCGMAMPDKAFVLLDEMLKSGYEVTIKDFSAIINRLCKRDFVHDAKIFFNKMLGINQENMASVEGSGFQIGMVGSLALSVASSVSIVICNKALMSSLGFPYATTLTSWHLMVTFCTLHVAQRFHLFEPKLIDAKTVVLFGILNGTSIGFLNLCLGFNSMTKLAIIPFTVLLETIFLKKKFRFDGEFRYQTPFLTGYLGAGNLLEFVSSKSIKFSLLVLLFGVGIASVTDLNLNLVGSILSFLAIATTCVGQIMTNTIQKRLKVSSTQLLYQSSPFQAAILFATGPSVDRLLTKRSVFAYNYSFMVLVFIVLSCLIAVSVNFSTFLVIGTTSPVTYQVLGHVKTCLILSFGYIILHDPFTARNIMGILTAVFGMGLYSYFSVQESKKKSANDSLPISQMAQKETVPLLASKNQDKDHNETKRSNGIPAASKDSFE